MLLWLPGILLVLISAFPFHSAPLPPSPLLHIPPLPPHHLLTLKGCVWWMVTRTKDVCGETWIRLCLCFGKLFFTQTWPQLTGFECRVTNSVSSVWVISSSDGHYVLGVQGLHLAFKFPYCSSVFVLFCFSSSSVIYSGLVGGRGRGRGACITYISCLSATYTWWFIDPHNPSFKKKQPHNSSKHSTVTRKVYLCACVCCSVWVFLSGWISQQSKQGGHGQIRLQMNRTLFCIAY